MPPYVFYLPGGDRLVVHAFPVDVPHLQRSLAAISARPLADDEFHSSMDRPANRRPPRTALDHAILGAC